jgi:hypothetical protein
MEKASQIERVRSMVHGISAELEPGGGAVEIDGASPEELAGFIREAAACTWALGISIETVERALEEKTPAAR